MAQVSALGLIWGFTFLFIKVSVEGLTPLWLVSVRTLSGFLVLVTAVLIRSVALPRDWATWGHIAFLAVPGNVAPWALVAWAQRGVTSAETAVLYSLIPVMTLLISSLLSMESLSLRKILGLILASVGTAITVGYQIGGEGSAGPVAVVLFACALLSTGAVYAKRYVTGRVPSLPMVTIQLGMAFVVSTTLAMGTDGLPEWELLTPPVVASALTLGALGTGVAFLIYYTLIGNIGATNATMTTYITPVIGVLAGWLILDEPITASLLAGGAAIVAGVWLAQRQRRTPVGSPGG